MSLSDSICGPAPNSKECCIVLITCVGAQEELEQCARERQKIEETYSHVLLMGFGRELDCGLNTFVYNGRVATTILESRKGLLSKSNQIFKLIPKYVRRVS